MTLDVRQLGCIQCLDLGIHHQLPHNAPSDTYNVFEGGVSWKQRDGNAGVTEDDSTIAFSYIQ
jgi:hypothetical protein